MKIIAISDTHGHLPTIPPCDLFIHCGDFCPATNHNVYYQSNFVNMTFLDWLDNIKAKHKIVVPGNHDLIFQQSRHLISKEVAQYILVDEERVVGDYRVWGTPWQPYFFNWAFNAPQSDIKEEFLAERYEGIHKGVDIVVSHCPPFQHGDFVADDRLNVGSKALLQAIKRARPQFVFCGHIHGAVGKYVVSHGQEETTIYNVSYLNENYQPYNNKILEINI